MLKEQAEARGRSTQNHRALEDGENNSEEEIFDHDSRRRGSLHRPAFSQRKPARNAAQSERRD